MASSISLSSISLESFDLLKMDRVTERRARASRTLRAVVWGGLLAFGVKRRGAVGLVAMAVSLERLYRTFAPDARHCLQALSRGGTAESVQTRDWDRVDQASWETFPASDPPGRL